MQAKTLGAALLGVLLGLAGGAGGYYAAARYGLLPEWLHVESHGHHQTPDLDHVAVEPQHDDGEEHASHAGHAGHGHEETGHGVSITPEVLAEMGVETALAGQGRLAQTLTLPGEIVINPDRVVHIVPRVAGVVREVRVTIGDAVSAGQILAVLDSRELAEAKSAYLAARQRRALAEFNLSANEELWKKGIVPDLEYLSARRELAEAEIAQRTAELKLHTLGVTHAELERIEEQPDDRFARHELRSPAAGVVTSKHITLGEVVTPEMEVFELADLSDVWIELTVYQQDLGLVRPGQTVTISTRNGHDGEPGRIHYVSPVADEATRTAVARVVLPNPEGHWRPGMFVTGRVETEAFTVPVCVPRTALQTIEGRPCVFVAEEEGFRPQPVSVGRTDSERCEITAGLEPGTRYVARGTFVLKAELEKGRFGDGHVH